MSKKILLLLLVTINIIVIFGCSDDDDGASHFSGKHIVNSPHGTVPKGSKAYSPDGMYYLVELEPYYSGCIAVYRTSDNVIEKEWDILNGSNDIKGLAWNNDSKQFAVMYHGGNNPGISIYNIESEDKIGYVDISKYYHYMEFSNASGLMNVSSDGETIETLSIVYYSTNENLEGSWNNDGDFEIQAVDTGIQQKTCYNNSPWGNNSWGLEGSTFSDQSNFTIDNAKFISSDGNIFLYGKDESNKWGLVKLTQGNIWGGTNCGPITWYCPSPLLTYNKELVIEIDIKRELNKLLADESWIMFAINVWFSSNELPSGSDINSRKPLVMDLILYHDCNWQGCIIQNFEDSDAFHYQTKIGETPYQKFQTWSISLSEHITKALNYQWDSGSINHVIDSLKLYQLDFVIEVKNAEGSAIIDNFVVKQVSEI